MRYLIRPEKREICGKDSTHGYLAFCSDVPEFHFETWGYSKRTTKQRNCCTDSLFQIYRTRNGSLDNNSIRFKWIIAGKEHRNTAKNESYDD